MKKHALASTALALAFGLLAAPTGVSAQEEAQERETGETQCQLQPTEASTKAATAIQAARDAEDPAQATQKWRDALEAVKQPVESGGEDPAPYILAAQAHIGLGEYERADALLEQFVELAPECTEEAGSTRYNAWVGLYNQGIQAYQSGDTQTALESFETANLIYEDARSYNNAAILHQQAGNTEKAKELYRNAMTAGGDAEQAASAATNLAQMLAAEGDTEAAIQVYEDYLAETPDDVTVKVQYALELSRAGHADSAVAMFETMLERTDLDEDQWNRIGVGLFNAEQYARSAVAFSKARQANPYNKEGMENLVSALVQADSAESALALADTLVAWFPYELSQYQLLANAQAKTNQGGQALQTLQQGERTPITFETLQMAEAGQGTYVIQGTLTGSDSAAGTTMTIPFELLGPDGGVVATEELSVTVPGPDGTETVRLQVNAGQEVAGFRYKKAGGEGIGN